MQNTGEVCLQQATPELDQELRTIISGFRV